MPTCRRLIVYGSPLKEYLHAFNLSLLFVSWAVVRYVVVHFKWPKEPRIFLRLLLGILYATLQNS